MRRCPGRSGATCTFGSRGRLGALPTSASDPPLAELAHHFVLAGPAAEAGVAIDYASRAAERATSLHAHEEAARLYQLGLQVGGLDDLERYPLLMRLGEALTRAGDEEGAQEAFWEAARDRPTSWP